MEGQRLKQVMNKFTNACRGWWYSVEFSEHSWCVCGVYQWYVPGR